MIFRWFKSKEDREFRDLLKSLRVQSDMQKQLAKAQSLKQLGRNQEALDWLEQLERTARDLVRRNPAAVDVHLFLAAVYEEMGATEQLLEILESLRTSTKVQLSAKDRLIVEAHLFRVQRERVPAPAGSPQELGRPATSQDLADASDRSGRDSAAIASSFTTVYCCPNCGRLRNACTVPCPHCAWAPQSVDDIARCWEHSTEASKIPLLLAFSRSVKRLGAAYLETPASAQLRRHLVATGKKAEFEQLLELLQRHEALNRRDIGRLCLCPDCDTRIAFAAADECRNCGNKDINFPVPERAIVCIDNLLIAIEEGLTILDSDAFSEFVCVLVRIQHQLVFHQKPPSEQHRRYALELLASFGRLVVGKNAAIVSVKDPANITCSVVPHVDEKIAVACVGLLMELRYFAELMRLGLDYSRELYQRKANAEAMNAPLSAAARRHLKKKSAQDK